MRTVSISLLLLFFGALLACTPQTEKVSATRPVVETAVPPTLTETDTAVPPQPTVTPIPTLTPTAVPTLVPTPTSEPAAPNQSNGRSSDPVISSDGRYIAFTSAGALTEEALNDERLAVFVRDRERSTTHLASITLDGRPPADDIYGFALSADGTTIAYYSFANDLAADDACPEDDVSMPCEDLFVTDWQSGETRRIPLGRTTGLGGDYTAALSPDGRYVAYDQGQIFDLQNDRPLSIFSQPPNGHTFAPAFAGNGDLAFVSAADNLAPDDANEAYDVFVWEAATGEISRVSLASDGAEGNDVSGALPFHEGVGDSIAISGDGRYVAFTSLATNLASEAVNQCEDYRGFSRTCYNLYLHDRETGETRLVVNGDGDTMHPALSGDGRFLVFSSIANNLVEGAPSCQFPAIVSCGQIYLFDQETGTFSLLSRTEDDSGDRGSWRPDISADGRFVTFVSVAADLVPGDTNGVSDIFLYDRETGQTELASVTDVR